MMYIGAAAASAITLEAAGCGSSYSSQPYGSPVAATPSATPAGVGVANAPLGRLICDSSGPTLSLHIAFKATREDVLDACVRLREAGATPLSFFATETTEPSVLAWMPAAAVYFRDPDGHLLEYLAMLDAEPRPELGILSWSQWQAAVQKDRRPSAEITR
jgi:catechol 2,3-dioxygenase-like lactoylglutathione lyase family enzyme